MTQTVGINSLDYPNLIACRAVCDGGRRLLAGVLFGGTSRASPRSTSTAWRRGRRVWC
jgi:hypothetical protein